MNTNISSTSTTTTIIVKKHPLHKKKLIIRPRPVLEEPCSVQVLEAQEQQLQEKQTQESLIEQYISQLNNQEKIVLKIATEHLKSSFDIEKSIGFQNWKKNV